MREFIEQTLRQKVTIKKNDSLYSKLPLAYKGRYDFFDVETNGKSWIAIRPKSDTGLVTLRKDHAKVQNAAGLNCALFLDNATSYIKNKLIEEGIPFVLTGKQVYLPFIGYLLSDSADREIAPVQLISYLTQRLILTAIYEKWDKVTVSEAAVRLGVTKTSVTRCFDEIEYMNIDILDMKGKTRAITVPADTRKLWAELQSVLRDPVIARYELQEDIQLEKKAGITALCEYSLLSDNNYPTYAITKREVAETGIRKMKKVRRGEEIGCVVLELGYFIDYKDNCEDPLSIALSLTDEEKQDERISISVDEMLEEYVW